MKVVKHDNRPAMAPLGPVLTARQQMVLRAVVAAYIANAMPASSSTVSHLTRRLVLSSAIFRQGRGGAETRWVEHGAARSRLTFPKIGAAL